MNLTHTQMKTFQCTYCKSEIPGEKTSSIVNTGNMLEIICKKCYKQEGIRSVGVLKNGVMILPVSVKTYNDEVLHWECLLIRPRNLGICYNID